MKLPSVLSIYKALYEIYGSQNWWPGDGWLEISLGAVLTQNTSWTNVARAIDNLKKSELLDLLKLLNAKPDYVKLLIKPVGFFNVKYKRLINLLEYFKLHESNMNRFSVLPLTRLRGELLEINGIGPETADSILLYAFNRLIFVVDAYTRRLFNRLGYSWMGEVSYKEIQNFFMWEIPSDVNIYNEYHALIVVHCKNFCKKKPLCSDCRISSICTFSIQT
ncbi:endonuclease [Candidatus Poribacteria bacterium]|nr:endonuclease [Candidatus Poribacteria bacterium]